MKWTSYQRPQHRTKPPAKPNSSLPSARQRNSHAHSQLEHKNPPLSFSSNSLSWMSFPNPSVTWMIRRIHCWLHHDRLGETVLQSLFFHTGSVVIVLTQIVCASHAIRSYCRISLHSINRGSISFCALQKHQRVFLPVFIEKPWPSLLKLTPFPSDLLKLTKKYFM